jgi:hypothetical protein
MLRVFGNETNNLITIGTNGSNSDSQIQINTTETKAVRIDNNGNVGIGTTDPQSLLDVNGAVTCKDFFGNGMLAEACNITAGQLGNGVISLSSGMVWYYTTTESAAATANFTYTGGLNTVLAVGQTVSPTVMLTASAAGFISTVQVDGNTVSVNWVGGDAPTEGGASGIDIYSFQIIRTSTATDATAWTVIASLLNAS